MKKVIIYWSFYLNKLIFGNLKEIRCGNLVLWNAIRHRLIIAKFYFMNLYFARFNLWASPSIFTFY